MKRSKCDGPIAKRSHLSCISKTFVSTRQVCFILLIKVRVYKCRSGMNRSGNQARRPVLNHSSANGELTYELWNIIECEELIH